VIRNKLQKYKALNMNRRGLKGKVKSLEEIIKEVKPTIV